MAKTQTKPKKAAPEQEPEPQHEPASDDKQIAKRNVSAFHQGLIDRENDWGPMLPQHVTKDKFMAAATEAIRQNPKLLLCTARSLYGAVAKAAKDGLLPDGREGVITPYKGEAQWNPMAWGLRKRARELDGIIVDAQVVRAADTFHQKQGDHPEIVHEPAPLNIDPGDLIGCYAIFRKGELILHREVMRKVEVETTRRQSKQPDSLMWAKFTTEAWKKVVVRRGFKSVPCSEDMQAIIRRDEEQYGVIEHDEPKAELPPPQTVQGALDKFAGDVEDAEVVETENGDTIDAKTGEVLSEAEANDNQPEGQVETKAEAKPKAKPAAKKKGNGEERYAPQVSEQNLGVILEALGSPMTLPDLKATVEGYAPIIVRLQPEHREKAVEALRGRVSKARNKERAEALIPLWESDAPHA